MAGRKIYFKHFQGSYVKIPSFLGSEIKIVESNKWGFIIKYKTARTNPVIKLHVNEDQEPLIAFIGIESIVLYFLLVSCKKHMWQRLLIDRHWDNQIGQKTFFWILC